MPAPELVIFDRDGVLIDSEVLGCAVDAEALTEAGIPITLDEILERFTAAEHSRPLAREVRGADASASAGLRGGRRHT